VLVGALVKQGDLLDTLIGADTRLERDAGTAGSGVQNRAGAVFFSLTLFGLGATTAAGRFQGLERAVRRREARGQYYAGWAAHLAEAAADAACCRPAPALL
jgi:hypothetical protein